MVIDRFNKTINRWMEALSKYDFSTLCTKPSPEHWSLGQVYMHLIENTNYFIEQAKTCATTDDNATEQCSEEAEEMFRKNSFPDALLDGPPENALTPQPESKEQVMNELLKIKSDAAQVHAMIQASQHYGKTKHPGLNYFSANEWIQFAEMHLRHHFRQKERIDAFLRINKEKSESAAR